MKLKKKHRKKTRTPKRINNFVQFCKNKITVNNRRKKNYVLLKMMIKEVFSLCRVLCAHHWAGLVSTELLIYFTMYLLFNHLIYFHRLFVFKKKSSYVCVFLFLSLSFSLSVCFLLYFFFSLRLCLQTGSSRPYQLFH